MDPWADPESFVRGGPTLTGFFCVVFCLFFLVDEGREDQNTTLAGHRPASGTPLNGFFRCEADDGPTLKAGLVAL